MAWAGLCLIHHHHDSPWNPVTVKRRAAYFKSDFRGCRHQVLHRAPSKIAGRVPQGVLLAPGSAQGACHWHRVGGPAYHHHHHHGLVATRNPLSRQPRDCRVLLRNTQTAQGACHWHRVGGPAYHHHHHHGLVAMALLGWLARVGASPLCRAFKNVFSPFSRHPTTGRC